jgi:hypothetical protein
MFGGISKRCLGVAEDVFAGVGFKVALLVQGGIPLWLRVECVEQLSLRIRDKK